MKDIIKNLEQFYKGYKFSVDEKNIIMEIDNKTIVKIGYKISNLESSASCTKIVHINDERIELANLDSIPDILIPKMEVKRDIYSFVYRIQNQINIDEYMYCLDYI